MRLRVLGCHGGESSRHRTSSFLIDERLAIDAGAVTSQLTLQEQQRVEVVLVSHAHMDHVRDLATLADNRCQSGGTTLRVVGSPGTIEALRRHYFNDALWPDFTRIPLADGSGPTLRLEAIPFEQQQQILGYRVRAVQVTHTIESAALLVERDGVAVAYSGDTGPTERLWEVLAETPSLRALLMEVSFPNDREELARVSGHHTPRSLARELRKLRGHGKELPVLLFHIKPFFQRQVERELARLGDERNLVLLRLGDEFDF